MAFALAQFHSIRPSFEVSQENILEWIAKAHSEAQALCSKWKRDEKDYLCFYQKIKERLFNLGLGEEKVQKRGLEFNDVFHQNWQEMQIYNLALSSQGAGHYERSLFYDKASTAIFERFYPKDSPLPFQLIHVTCTGYVAPSPAQKLISRRGAGSQTLITHAYHMGCYASIPAIRMALGFMQYSPEPTQNVDIVHTELCSLHMNPLMHQTDQLVIQSLFGDGYIKYSLVSENQAKHQAENWLTLHTVHEEVIADSTEAMTWLVADWGMCMFIAKEVPVLIVRSLENFISTLIRKTDLDPEKIMKNAFFAIHPGGPKIIKQIQKILGLKPAQIAHSQKVLQEYGNMSSATLPHVWNSMLDDPGVPSGSLVLSLAFGPGLNIAGGLFEKKGIH